MIPVANFLTSSGTHPHRWLNKLFVFVLLSNLLFACGEHNSTTPVLGSNELSGITLGHQVWSATNLDVGRFRNGDSIPEVRSNEEWEKAGKEGRPAWCYYANDTEKGRRYGRLYNWFAVNDPRGLCPKGWHIPTNEEWIALENHLGIPVAGTRLKCNKGWNANGNGDNSSNLCVLPGGYRDRNGKFTGVGEFIYISGLTEDKLEDSKDDKKFIWGRGVQFESKVVMRCGLDKEFGLYVRCLKDKS